ncbi:triple tyrosine motif-containing protein [Gillisia sp. CAL575]|uniref:helix-turn-helix and ligand-binding sensor domain-containing protein n=1 Tax=Gillisia sp. CAL575 TaxID=985255 RepID=UPI0003A27EBF|nr:triple tyrosine motif-containing protein [Gillisia sp. CAL575]
MRLFFLIFILYSISGFSQELPPVINFDPNDYGGGNQNWMISQGENDNFYFANGAGLLEYDGERFQLYPVPNNSIVRSVINFDGRVYTGAYMEAGYWVKDDFGVLCYKSIIEKFPNGVLDGELFWDIKTLEGLIIFRSFSGIYFYDPEKDKVLELNIPENKPVSGLFKLKDELYFQLVGGGLYEIKKGRPQLIIPYKSLGDLTIKHIYGASSNLKFVTENSGFFSWKEGVLLEINRELSQKIDYTNIFAAIAIPGEGMILGTVGKGILQIDETGKIVHNFNQENVLLNNTVLSLYNDKMGNIWAGLDYGISMINSRSDITSFNDVKGKIGSVYASHVQNGNLYLGTNQGLYFKEKESDDLLLIPGTNGQVWNINYIDGLLFCSHDTGTFLINGNKAEKISDRLGTWFVKKLSEDTYVQGHYYGFSFIKNVNGKLIASPLVKGFPHSSRYIEKESDSVLWVNNEHKGVFRVKYNVNANKIEKLENFKFSDSIWATSGMFQFVDTLYYSTQTKIYQFNKTKNKFSDDNRLNELVSGLDKISGKMINENNEKLWGFANNQIFQLKPSNITGDYELEFFNIEQSFRNIAEGYENITPINEDEYLIGIANGYLRMKDTPKKEKNFEIRITEIQFSALDEKPKRAVLGIDKKLKTKENNISLYFSTPVYDKYSKALYSYRLKGLSSKWSSWDHSSQVNFKNLRFGQYSFEVKAKIGDKITSVTSYNFSIDPPFYFSTLAIIGYFLLFFLILIIVHFVNRQHHRKIVIRNERTLKLKNLEAEKQIINLKNEKLEQDMANKNRELAVSTMSLIKKNEFLTSIKEKLKDSEDSSKVRSVIKTIDKDISDEDNWKFFKKAFSNADKDFFKKVKEKHPELTSNDLKLCAYLRLNLSSKEIAPLLNISVKSIEIKRYRLRKKMNLDRNTNLTDYILAI